MESEWFFKSYEIFICSEILRLSFLKSSAVTEFIKRSIFFIINY
jgi:hypothetical protein